MNGEAREAGGIVDGWFCFGMFCGSAVSWRLIFNVTTSPAPCNSAIASLRGLARSGILLIDWILSFSRIAPVLFVQNFKSNKCEHKTSRC